MLRFVRPALLGAAVLLCCTAAASALEVSVNGRTYEKRIPADIPWDPVPLALPYEQRKTGYVLGEILPLFTAAYRIEISSAEGRTVLEQEGLGDLLFRSYLLTGEERAELYIAGRRLRGVERIAIRGEQLTEGPLTVWLSWEGVDRLKEELRRFAGYHGIELSAQRIPNTGSKLTAVLRGGGELPDLVMVQSSSVAELRDARALQRLDYLDLSYADERGRGAFRLAGGTWAAPFYCDTQMLFYNPELVPGRPAAGWSFAEFEELARRTGQQSGIQPAAWNAYSAYWLSPFLFAFGKERLIEEDGSIVIRDEATRRAVEYLLELRGKGLLKVSERSAMVSDFAAGRTAMILTGSYSIPHFRQLQIPFRPLPLPVNGETGRAAAPFLDFKGFAISRRSRSPILARRFLQFLTGPGLQQRFCAAVHKLPARRDVWPEMAERLAYFDAMQSSYRQGRAVPPERAYGVYKNTMWKLLRFVFSGRMSVEEVLSTGQRLIDNTLREARALQEQN